MTHPSNPFTTTTPLVPGIGTIHLTNLSAQTPHPTPVLQQLEYQYPLKLIAPNPVYISTITTTINPPSTPSSSSDAEASAKTKVYTIFLLTYGGGLVASDAINLHIQLDASTVLNLLTQGSTKIFKTRPPATSTTQSSTARTQQHLSAHIASSAALVYLPDPVQPFAGSEFTQSQTYVLAPSANLCVLDWVTAGRPARGEVWSCGYYASRNEIYATLASSRSEGDERRDVPSGERKGPARGRLLLRDNIVLDSRAGGSIAERVHHAAVFGTLIITGPLFAGLSEFVTHEFERLPRVGAPALQLSSGVDDASESESQERTEWRKQRWTDEKADNVLWTASRVRGAFTVVKFSAASIEAGRSWLRGMIDQEGSVRRVAGERGLMCLR